jgi:PST family polysaccharide transporter
MTGTVAAPAEERSYGQILKSSALIGGSSVAVIAVGVVRTKAMAVMLGPAGFGLMGLYSSIIDLVLAVASLGLGASGVRQIAEAAASGDNGRIGRTVLVLRRTAVVLGLLGLGLTVLFAEPLAVLTFGSADHAPAVALLSLAVFFRVVAAGQGALIQGLRRIADLARLNIIGAVLGTVLAIVLVWLWGERGVAPALVGAAALALATSWWYSRKVAIAAPVLTAAAVRQETAALLKLGFAFMASGILMMGAAYAVRTIVLRQEGLDAAGYYSAAWTLGGLYVGIILQAMGADFYPRLVGAADDPPRCNRLVNEQTQVSLLLAGPGVIATLTFASLVISLFYSAKFAEAVEVLRWICLGVALRVITWPIGFIIVAKNRQLLFLATEIAWTVVNVGLTWLCVRAHGLAGAGIAFFASYVFHAVMIYPIVHHLTGFRWSRENVITALLFTTSIAGVFIAFQLLAPLPATLIGTVVMLANAGYALHGLLSVVDGGSSPLTRPLQRLLAWSRLRRPAVSGER